MNAPRLFEARGGLSLILFVALILISADVFAQARGRTADRPPARSVQQADTSGQAVPRGAATTPAGQPRTINRGGSETPAGRIGGGAAQPEVPPVTPQNQGRTDGSRAAQTRDDRTQPETSRGRDADAVRDRQNASRERNARPQSAPAPNPQPAPRPVPVIVPRPHPVVTPIVYATNRWSPRYLYRQTYYVDSGWGPFRRSVRVDVHTELRHRVRSVRHDRKIVDVQIERISIFERGRYIGEVTRIPGSMSRMRATIYRNGYMDLDQMIYVVGERRSGFELIATRHFDGMFYHHYRPAYRMRVGELDFRSRRVMQTRFSRLIGDGRFDGYVPVPVLHYDDDWYFVHGYYDPRGRYFYDYDWFYAMQAPAQTRTQTPAPQPRQGNVQARGRTDLAGGQPRFNNQRDDRFRTDEGAEIRIRRESEITRLGD